MGASGLTLADLKPVAEAWQRRCPEPLAWFEARPGLWQSLCDALGMRLELVEGDELARFRCVVERVADPRLEIALAEAKEVDDGFAVGDDFGVIVGRADMLWRWLFDQAWQASQGHA